MLQACIAPNQKRPSIFMSNHVPDVLWGEPDRCECWRGYPRFVDVQRGGVQIVVARTMYLRYNVI